jgi:hypothetical protein
MPQTTRKHDPTGRPSRVLVELGRVPALESHGLPPRSPGLPGRSGRSLRPARGQRRIGTIGTASRALGGLGLVYLALASGLSWGLAWHEAVLGLLAFPAATVAVGLAARRYADGPLRFTGQLGLALNTAAIVALYVNPYTADAAALFYGVTLLVAAWQALPGCEVTVLSNWILRRDDQIGCPVFTPIDDAEARLRDRRSQLEARKQTGAAVDEGKAAGLGDLGLLHVVACCGFGAAALIAITLT